MNFEQSASRIWNQVDRGAAFAWPKSEKVRNNSVTSLSKLLPDEQFDLVYPFGERASANRQLRSCLSLHLTKPNAPHQGNLKADLAHWIVVEWGGIRSGSNTIRDWSRELGDHTPTELDVFSTKMGKYRISSWSKLLAFTDPKTHAIYDARTAVALNCILSELGEKTGFYMPVGRNSKVEPMRRKLRNNGFQEKRGYKEYIALLKAMAAVAKTDILEIEMALFANAPAITDGFSNSRTP